MTNDEIYKKIMIMESVKAAISFVKASEISKSDLNKLCKRYNLFVSEKATKEEIITLFVNSTLGVKLKKKSINRFKTK
jgi:hypothetical protein